MLLFLFNCCHTDSNRSGDKFTTDKTQADTAAELVESPVHQTDCFLKLSNSTLIVESPEVHNCFANVVVRYEIEGSKIKGNVQIMHLYVFRNTDKEIIFNSDEDRLDNSSQLTNAICDKARQNLVDATIHCKTGSVTSWGAITMHILFK